ncbi:hypothetical protein GCM10027446_31030 [Angustibacter peucedani]
MSEPTPEPTSERFDEPTAARGPDDVRTRGPRRRRREKERDRAPVGPLALLRETVIVVVIALGLSLLVKTFLVQAFFIPSVSMEDTLKVGDRVVVSKLTPGPFDLHRGDVVVFEDPGDWLPPDEPTAPAGPVRKVLTFVGLLPNDSGNHLIKRVIGLPGDHVKCCDSGGRVLVDDVPLEEPYLHPGDKPSEKTFDVQVPQGQLWVMGDHRQESEDSRYKGFVPLSRVTGRAIAIVWPFPRADWLSRPEATFAKVDSSSP